jgi:hypothetical protein
MTEIILLSNPKKYSNAEFVLIEHGYKVISIWLLDNLFKKDGKFYKIAHPVWDNDKVRITEAGK